jgi:hypothetical protein
MTNPRATRLSHLSRALSGIAVGADSFYLLLESGPETCCDFGRAGIGRLCPTGASGVSSVMNAIRPTLEFCASRGLTLDSTTNKCVPPSQPEPALPSPAAGSAAGLATSRHPSASRAVTATAHSSANTAAGVPAEHFIDPDRAGCGDLLGTQTGL